MKKLFLFLTISLSLNVVAQEDQSIEVLKAPSSPGANLLGTSPSDIQQFTDPSSFMVSLQKATSNFSAIPTNYAVDIAPAWLFQGSKIRYEDFFGIDNMGKRKKNLDRGVVRKCMKQTLVVSVATKASDNISGNFSLGIGAKMSLVRGHVSKEVIDAVDSIIFWTGEINALRDDSMAIVNDNSNQEAKERMWDLFRKKRKSIGDMVANSKRIASKLNFKRYGLNVDIAGGTVLDYPHGAFDSAIVNKWGGWLTAGYEWECGLSALTIARLLSNPDKVFANNKEVIKTADIMTFDFGGRLIYSTNDEKFNFSGEVVYRKVLQQTDVRPAYRFTLNAEYQVGLNKKLSFAFGRDYDGKFQHDGNVIAALNLIMGFGNKRL